MTTLVVGIGSPIRGDDGVGLRVVEQLRCRGLPAGVEAMELGTGGLALLDVLSGYDRLVIVDAIVSGAAPGTVIELAGDDVSRTEHLGEGHEADLPTLLELARRGLGADMPTEVVVVAVEAGDVLRITEELSPAVAAAVDEAVERVLAIL
ncbi:MAG: hydrogenase maturation protease [Deltaproteobacteria bacterium]|nr:hydrogenase maturation protease [Deltaproteobacteria bacterium]